VSSRFALATVFIRRALLIFTAFALAACGPPKHAAAPGGATTADNDHSLTDPEKVLNVYNWTDYIAPDIVPAFEKEYGIKVNYDFYDSNDVLQTKLLTGHTGYDIVVPTGSFAAGQIKAGVFRKLDKGLIPNLKYVDPDLARRMDPLDPGLEHSVNYFWGTEGVGYNVNKVRAAMADAPVDSLRMFYDPNVIRHFKECGVMLVDEPREIVSTVLLYLGRDGTSESPEDLAAAEKVLMAIRPYIRYIDNERYLNDLANGEICLALGWSNDVLTAATRAREAGNGNLIRYNIPKEGAVMFIDMMGIPADSPHPKNAHLFINYLLRPEVSARNSSFVHAATSNAAAYPLIDPAIYNDRAIYPSAETKQRLIADLPRSQAYTRSLTRMWARFKAGR
jgi:putrescine transport system substrate-binding protein